MASLPINIVQLLSAEWPFTSHFHWGLKSSLVEKGCLSNCVTSSSSILSLFVDQNEEMHEAKFVKVVVLNAISQLTRGKKTFEVRKFNYSLICETCLHLQMATARITAHAFCHPQTICESSECFGTIFDHLPRGVLVNIPKSFQDVPRTLHRYVFADSNFQPCYLGMD